MTTDDLLLYVAISGILICAVWMYWDSFQASIAETGEGSHTDSLGWAFGAVLLWIVAFPAYLYARREARAKRLEKGIQPVSGKGGSMVPLSAALTLLAIAGAITWAVLPRVPGCGDERTLDLVRQVVQQYTQSTAPKVQVKIDIKTVLSEGFDKDAQKWQCSAKVRLSAADSKLNDQLAKAPRVAAGNVELLGALILWENTPYKEAIKRGYFDVDLAYLSTLELQSNRQLVNLNMTGGDREALVTYLSLASAFSSSDVQRALQAQAAPVGDASVPVATPTSNGSPESPVGRTFKVKALEKCGEEALCVHTATGETLTTNVYALDEAALKSLDAAASDASSRCFLDVSGEGKQLTFEGVKYNCNPK